MADLIDRKKALRQIQYAKKFPYCITEYNRVLFKAQKIIKNLPPADTERQAYLVNGNCSKCNTPIPTNDRYDSIDNLDVEYCYCCGRKFVGIQND